ncbi:hypothetical protein Aperf_G00000115509 [Anoplocephala perfoliata]
MDQPRPYELCRYILEHTRESRAVHFVGEWLSKAVTREWKTELRPDNIPITEENFTQTLPYQLVEFLINWVFTRDFEVSLGAQQKILIAAAVIVKLAALDEISITDSNGMQDELELESRGICPLLNVFIQNIVTNLVPIPLGSTYQQERRRILVGLSLFMAVISEFSSNERAFYDLDFTKESFLAMQIRFEGFEWVKLLRTLIDLIGSLLVTPDWVTSIKTDEVGTYQLVNCLELITTFDFHSKKSHKEHKDLDSSISVDRRWESVLGTNAIINCLSVLFRFYGHLRKRDDYSRRVLTSIVTVASVTFRDRPVAYNVEHSAICMSALARGLVSLNVNPLEGISAILLSGLESEAFRPLELSFGRRPAPHILAVEIERVFHPIGDAFLPFELPLLALLSGCYFPKVRDLLKFVQKYFNLTDSATDEEVEFKISVSVFYLNAAYEFLAFAKNILYACLIIEAGVLKQTRLDDDEMHDAIGSAHEASERMLGQIKDAYSDISYWETNIPLPLTTGERGTHGQTFHIVEFGPFFNTEYLVYHLKQVYLQTRNFFESHLRDILRVCIASRIAPPEGFRNDDSLEIVKSDASMDDKSYYEESLYEIGELANAFSCRYVDTVLNDLGSLLSVRVGQWIRLTNATSKAVIEDIHQILLFMGHILVQGQSDFDTTRGGRYAWEGEFLPTCAVLESSAELTFEQIRDIHEYLNKAIDAADCGEPNFVPSFLKLFRVLFRFLGVLVGTNTSASQLDDDLCWLFTRLVLGIFSFRTFKENALSGSEDVRRPIWQEVFRPVSGGRPWDIERLKITSVHLARSLTYSAIRILNRRSGEPNIVKGAQILLVVVARHILPLVGNKQSSQRTAESLAEVVGLWQQLGAAMIASTQQANFPADYLIDLTNACAQGCWHLREVFGQTGNLFYQFLAELEPLMPDNSMGDNPEHLKYILPSGLAVVRGLSRAVCGIMRDTSCRLITDAALKISMEGSKEIPGFIWQRSFLQILSLCVSPFFQVAAQEAYSSPVLTEAVLSAFDEVAESVLPYLPDITVTLMPQQMEEFKRMVGGVHICLPEPYTAATQFLMLSILLCNQYRMAHYDSATNAFRPVGERRQEELQVISSLLQFILHFGLENRYPKDSNTPSDSPGQHMLGGNVCFACLRLILPLITENHLKVDDSLLGYFHVPETSTEFFKLLSNITYNYAGSVLQLFDANSTEALSQLGQILRFGVSQNVSETVTSSTLDTIYYLADYCLSSSSTTTTTTTRDAATEMIVTHLHFNGMLMSDLFDLMLDKFPLTPELVDRICQCLFTLTQLSLESFERAASEFMAKCGGGDLRRRREVFQQTLIELHSTMSVVNEYMVANQYLRLIQPYDADFYIPSPSAVLEKSFTPVLYSRRRRCTSLDCSRSFDSLPGLVVSTLPDSARFEIKISHMRLFKGQDDDDMLIICLSNDNGNLSVDCRLVIRPPSDQILPWTLGKRTRNYLFAVVPTPQVFHDIHLQIHTSDWLVYLTNPLDLDNIQSYAEVADGNSIEDAISDLTHPWKIRLKISRKEDSVKEGLVKIFRCHLVISEWTTIRQGLFSGCRIRLTHNPTGELVLEALSRYRNVHCLLIDRLKHEGFSASEDGQTLESELITPNDLRDALLTELRLLKSALCGPLIRHTMKSTLPLITERSLPKTSSALKIAGIFADWREVAGGSKPIDRSVVAEVVGETNIGVIAAACATTNSIISRLSL